MKLPGFFFGAACSLVALVLHATASEAAVTAITGVNVVAIAGGPPLENAVVLVEGERIAAVASGGDVEVPADATVIDGGGAWLIPGLMNMHVHFGLVLPGEMKAKLSDETEGELTLRMAAAARKSLQAGVTTVRSPGDQRHGDLALRQSIRKGESHGPRIFSAGEGLRISGGHGAGKGMVYADGPYELMKKARTEISLGAEWIKIYISGGIATDGGGIAEALMTPEEINAVVDSAHRFGAQVTAHSGSPQATEVAVDAGIDCIEHGYYLDRKVLKKMEQAGTWLVPTIVVSQPATEPFFKRIGSPEWYLKRRDSVGEVHWNALTTAIEEGVNIALGTDQFPHEPNDGTTATVREAEYYVEAGMTPLQALQAATIEPARMLRADDEIGSVEVGKYADLVLVKEDPTANISALRDIRLVMKGGRVYRNDL